MPAWEDGDWEVVVVVVVVVVVAGRIFAKLLWQAEVWTVVQVAHQMHQHDFAGAARKPKVVEDTLAIFLFGWDMIVLCRFLSDHGMISHGRIARCGNPTCSQSEDQVSQSLMKLKEHVAVFVQMYQEPLINQFKNGWLLGETNVSYVKIWNHNP